MYINSENKTLNSRNKKLKEFVVKSEREKKAYLSQFVKKYFKQQNEYSKLIKEVELYLNNKSTKEKLKYLTEKFQKDNKQKELLREEKRKKRLVKRKRS